MEFATSCAASFQRCWPCRDPTCALSAPTRRLTPRSGVAAFLRACSCSAVEPASPLVSVSLTQVGGRKCYSGAALRSSVIHPWKPERPVSKRVPRALLVASLPNTHSCYVSVLTIAYVSDPSSVAIDDCRPLHVRSFSTLFSWTSLNCFCCCPSKFS